MKNFKFVCFVYEFRIYRGGIGVATHLCIKNNRGRTEGNQGWIFVYYFVNGV